MTRNGDSKVESFEIDDDSLSRDDSSIEEEEEELESLVTKTDESNGDVGGRAARKKKKKTTGLRSVVSDRSVWIFAILGIIAILYFVDDIVKSNSSENHGGGNEKKRGKASNDEDGGANDDDKPLYIGPEGFVDPTFKEDDDQDDDQFKFMDNDSHFQGEPAVEDKPHLTPDGKIMKAKETLADYNGKWVAEVMLGLDSLPDGFRRPERQFYTGYKPRVENPETQSTFSMATFQGEPWSLTDKSRSRGFRLKEEDYAKYPGRDVPWEEIPDYSWHKDRTYRRGLLREGPKFVQASMEILLAEYGHFVRTEQKSFEERAAMFTPTILDLDDDDALEEENFFKKVYENAGWMSKKAYDGLVRRILHAVITEDSFTFVMGGHSAAAGHGNNFQQSYTMQVQEVLEPIFARFNVLFISHNFGMGGLGTSHNAQALGDIYGKDIDLLMWDSGVSVHSCHPSDFESW